MTTFRIGQHRIETWLEPFAILDLPDSNRDKTLHGELRLLPSRYANRPIVVLTELGRNILCAHISGSLPRTSLSVDLVAGLSVNTQVNPPTKLNSWGFQFLNVLWDLRGIALRRSDLNAIKSALTTSFGNHPHPEWFPKSSDDDDIIQHVNKTSQWGLKHNSEILKTPLGDNVHYYWIDSNLEFCSPSTLRKPTTLQNFTTVIPPCTCSESQTPSKEIQERNLESERRRVIQYLNDVFVNVPVSEWTLEGHRDAQNKDRGTVAQPKKFNRSSRDRWKFDDYGLTICPSIGNLAANLRTFYPSNEELIELVQALQHELGELFPRSY